MKPFLSIDDQLLRIKGRGMIVDDEDEARRWLAAIGYYRLSGYWYPFRAPDSASAGLSDRFLPDSSFTEVIQLYEFDRHLKTLILSGLERIEVAMRSQIGHVLGAHDPQAYKNIALFRSTFNHGSWNSTAGNRIARARGRDSFVDHHDLKYGGQLPIWVLTDVLDFADISKLFEGMKSTDQRVISDWFGLLRDPDISNNQKKKWNRRPPLVNWLEHLTVVRNICAHHGRLWNRQLTPVGTRVTSHLSGFEGVPPDQAEHVYMTICITAFLLDTTSPGNTWSQKVGNLVHNTFAHFRTARSKRWASRATGSSYLSGPGEFIKLVFLPFLRKFTRTRSNAIRSAIGSAVRPHRSRFRALPLLASAADRDEFAEPAAAADRVSCGVPRCGMMFIRRTAAAACAQHVRTARTGSRWAATFRIE